MNTAFIRLPEAMRRTGLSRSQIYALIQGGKFPRQVELGLRAVGWIEEEIQSWIASKINASRHGHRAVKPPIGKKASNAGEISIKPDEQP
jgi:prophage regulatory protein